jgi:mannitol/fructose-specific phosphotransferase system IIA component
MKGWMMSMIERRGWMAKGTVENAYVETVREASQEDQTYGTLMAIPH